MERQAAAAALARDSWRRMLRCWTWGKRIGEGFSIVHSPSHRVFTHFGVAHVSPYFPPNYHVPTLRVECNNEIQVGVQQCFVFQFLDEPTYFLADETSLPPAAQEAGEPNPRPRAENFGKAFKV